ncbi:hypothetical protein DV738_g2727, partial [Chaetothyriales sp. CBS 135597]
MTNYTTVPILGEETKRRTARVQYHVPAFEHYRPSETLREQVRQAGAKQLPHLTELMKLSKRGRSKFAHPTPKPEQPAPEGQVWLYDEEKNEWFLRERKPLKETLHAPATPAATPTSFASSAISSSGPTSPATSPATTILGKRKASEAELLTPPASQEQTGTKRIRRRARCSLFFKPKHMGLHRDDNNCMADQQATESGVVVHKDTLTVCGAGGAKKGPEETVPSTSAVCDDSREGEGGGGGETGRGDE